MTFILKLLFFSIVFIFGLAFHLKNHQLVLLNYYISEIQLPLSLLVVISLCIGIALCILVTFPIIIRLKKNNNKLIKKFERHEKILNRSDELKI